MATLLLFGQLSQGQTRFQIPLTVKCSDAVQVVRFGVSPGNTFGVDANSSLGTYLESSAPPLPPVNVFEARWKTISGHPSTYPAGLGIGTYTDFRSYTSAAQVDSFLLNLTGDFLLSDSVSIIFPRDLADYADTWTIKTIGSTAIPATNMLTTSFVSIPSDGATTNYNVLIIKTGAKATEQPRGWIPFVIDATGPYDFDHGISQYDSSSNKTGLTLLFTTLKGKGSVTVSMYNSSAANISFTGTAPLHISSYRWVITPYALTTFHAQVIFRHTMFSSGINSSGTIKVYRRPTSGTGSFTEIAQIPPLGTITITVGMDNDFGEFIFAANDNQLTGVDNVQAVPSGFALMQNYPNPFNPSTEIEYRLPKAQHVHLGIFDLQGREVAVLVDGEQLQGTHIAVWNATTLSSGIYFARLTSPLGMQVRKMILLK